MISNHARVGRALYLLKIDLDNFIPREFQSYHAEQSPEVLNQIISQNRDVQRPFQNMKTQDLLAVMQAAWWDVFNPLLTDVEPVLIRELAMVHEAWANRQPFTADSAFQALTAIQKLLAAMSSPSIMELETLKVESRDSELESEEYDSIPAQESLPHREEDSSPVAVLDDSLADESADSAEAEASGVTEETSSAEPGQSDFLRRLRDFGAVQERDTLMTATSSGATPENAAAAILAESFPELAQALAGGGGPGLYVYQQSLIAAAADDANLVLEAGWGSEPVISWAIPLAECLRRNPGGAALVICPEDRSAPAIAAQLEQLLSVSGIRVMTVSDAPLEAEDSDLLDAADPGLVLVASMDQLNRTLLARKGEWLNVLESLKFVALVQSEEYRGHFGASAALLLRRFNHLLSILGAGPQYLVVASGCANGTEFAEALTGAAFQPVVTATGPAPQRHFLSVSIDEPDSRFPDEFRERIARAALACREADQSVIVCCPDTDTAGQIYQTFLALTESQGREGLAAEWLREGDSETRDSGNQSPDSPGARVVFAGISPVSDLDCAGYSALIMAGFPARLRDGLGVIERSGAYLDTDTYVLHYALNNRADRFVAANLPWLADKRPDHLVVDSENPEIIRSHLPAFLQESEGRIYSFTAATLGSAFFQELRRTASELPVPKPFPQGDIDLQISSDSDWSLLAAEKRVAVVSDYRKFREVYAGAVFPLGVTKFRVPGVSQTEVAERFRSIALEAAEGLSAIRTEPSFSRSVEVRDESLCLSPASGISLHLGNIHLEEGLTHVTVVTETPEDTAGGEGSNTAGQSHTIEIYTPENGNAREFTASSFWLDVAALRVNDDSDPAPDATPVSPPALAALEQMFRIGIFFTFSVDAYEIITHSEAGKVFIIESSPGGLGIVKKAFDLWRDILEFGAQLAARCPCKSGCPNCLIPSYPQDRDLDKAAGLTLAYRLLEATRVS